MCWVLLDHSLCLNFHGGPKLVFCCHFWMFKSKYTRRKSSKWGISAELGFESYELTCFFYFILLIIPFHEMSLRLSSEVILIFMCTSLVLSSYPSFYQCVFSAVVPLNVNALWGFSMSSPLFTTQNSLEDPNQAMASTFSHIWKSPQIYWLNINLIKKHAFTVTFRLVYDQISGYCGLIKLNVKLTITWNKDH